MIIFLLTLHVDLFRPPVEKKSRSVQKKCLKFPPKMINFQEILLAFLLRYEKWHQNSAIILPTHFVTIMGMKKHKLRASMFVFLSRFVFNATYFLCTIHKDQQRFMWFHVTNYSLLHNWAFVTETHSKTGKPVYGWQHENIFHVNSHDRRLLS